MRLLIYEKTQSACHYFLTNNENQSVQGLSSCVPLHDSLFMMHKLQSTLCTVSRIWDVLIRHLRRPTITSRLTRAWTVHHRPKEVSGKKITFSCWTSSAVAPDVVPANQINPQRDSQVSSVWSDSCSGSHTSFSVHVYKIVDKHVETLASFKNSPSKSGLWKPTPLFAQSHISQY